MSNITLTVDGAVVYQSGSTPAPGPSPTPTPVPPPAPPVPPGTTVVVAPWNPGVLVRQYLRDFSNQIFAVQISVPASYTAVPIAKGKVRTAQASGFPAVARDWTVSKLPGDFTSGNYLYNGIGSSTTSPGGGYTVNNPAGGGLFNIQAGETVYLNIKNVDPSVTADMLCETTSPK